MAFTDQQILQQIQYAMLEPPDNGQTYPSGMWTLSEVSRYADQRQNEFLKNTQAQIGIVEIAATAGVDSYNLPSDWITSVRVVWKRADGTTKQLTRSDTWEADHGIPNWDSVEQEPKIYFEATPLTLFVAAVPIASGTIRLYFTPTGALITGAGEIFTVPDMFVPGVKYGIMADMLSKVGRGHDIRADYCTQRFQLGVEIARMLTMGWRK